MIPLRDDQPTFSTPFINYFLIVLNLLVFALGSCGRHAKSPRHSSGLLVEFGLVPHHSVAVLTGHSYDSRPRPFCRSSPPCFCTIRFPVLHVGGNMLFLWIFGDNVEDYLGHFRYLVFYLGSGIAGNVTHVLLNASSNAPSIGASGAIAGVMGAYFILYPRARVLTWFPPIFLFHVPAWLMLGYWFLVQFLRGSVTAIATRESGWRHRLLGARGRLCGGRARDSSTTSTTA